MVVQCPTCQSKFRIADEKVTDRGVRVRCTSCKNVFQVRKPGAAASAEPAPGPGSTIDLSSLDAAQVGSGQSRPAAPSRPLPASGPSAASRPPGVAARSGNGAARRLDADDLFGMAELTGDAPLGDLAPPSKVSPSPPPPVKAGVSKPVPSFDDIDLEVDEPLPPVPSRPPSKPIPRPPSKPIPRPPPVEAAAAESQPVAEPPPEAPPPDQGPGADDELGPVKIGAFRPAKDPFEGISLGEPGSGAFDVAGQQKKEKLPTGPVAPVKRPAPEPEMAPARAMVSSALTGMMPVSTMCCKLRGRTDQVV